MNTLVKSLSSQKTLQNLLCAVLQYLQKYFRTVGLLSEQKTYSTITKMCSRVHSKLSSCHSITSLSRKLILNIETKINDKEDDEKKVDSASTNASSVKATTVSKKKSPHGMKSFICNIAANIETEDPEISCEAEEALEDPPTRNPSSESEFAWIRKTVLEEIQLLRDDIEEAEEKFQEHTKQLIGKYRGGVRRHILITESHLESKGIIDCIIEAGWLPIIIKNQSQMQMAAEDATAVKAPGKADDKKKTTKKGEKELEAQVTPIIRPIQVTSYLYKTHMCLVSSDVITKSGGVMSPSGSLMTSLSCRKYKVPVVILSRDYCLSDQTLLTQQSLTVGVNPSQMFDVDSDDFGVFLFKKYDFIQSQCIDTIVTEQGSWNVENIAQVENRYWSY